VLELSVCAAWKKETGGEEEEEEEEAGGTCEISRRPSDILSKNEKAYGGQ
tara:strand:- start:117 stop:266 length:150 start_codon:yes stop_codon:yes gene_type:complete